MSLRQRSRKRLAKIKDAGFAFAGTVGEVFVTILRETKPDQITINPKTKEVTIKYKREF